METLLLASFIACLASFILTPLARKVAFALNIVDKPDYRKVHKKAMPYLGGVAIYLGFMIGFIAIWKITSFTPSKFTIAYLIGAFIIVVTGVLDDKFNISPKQKLFGQLMAACVVVFYGGKMVFLNVPFISDGMINIGWIGIPIALIWIVGITNAVNLIDGLDGLASGVSAIACLSIFGVSVLMGNSTIPLLSILLCGAILGFLYFNFHPAKLFMGDTGSLFLGFSLATFSLLEFKQIALISFIVPILILVVPISDTFYAILRRFLNKQSISAPDKNHLHHRLLQLGLSHRKTVLVIYAISAVFGLLAIFLVQTKLWIAFLIILGAVIAIELFAEMIGLVNHKKYKPLLSIWNKTFKRK